jgi:uncharacterized membrane protein
MWSYLLFENYFVVLILFISGLFLQNISNLNKKSIFYGVRIPIGYEKSQNLIKLHKQYQKSLIISFTILLIILTLIVINISDEIAVILIVPETFLSLAVIALHYFIIYKKTKQLKNNEGWSFESKNVVIVDTSFREKDDANKKAVIPPWWFLVPLSVMIITVIGILIKYPTMSAQIPMHNNVAGQINQGGDENFIIALSFTIIQVLINLVFFGSYKLTEKAKQSLNGGKIGEIKYRSRKTRYYLSISYLLIAILINLLIMVIGFSMCNIINPSLINSNGFMITSILLPIIILGITILAIVKGSNDSKYISKSEVEQQLINRDDDQYYKFGSLYYNKNDPALFVEKRTGIGTTLNFARPAAKISISILLVIIVVPLVLMAIFMPGMTKERQIDISQDTILISGTWGPEISKDQIIKVTIENKLPKVIMKTNGADINKKLFGKHKLEGYNESVLFIIDNTKPFVAIYLKDGRLILINYEDEKKTQSLYEKIISTLKLPTAV